jgi:hypothetical protein
MEKRDLDSKQLLNEEDWQGNNAAFTCPHCGKVFIVSQMIHHGQRQCPECSKSKGYVNGGKESGGAASIEW